LLLNRSLEYRACCAAIFAASLASCSPYGGTGSVPSQGAAAPQRVFDNASIRPYRLVADGLAGTRHTGARARGWILPDANKRPSQIYWGNNLNNTVTIFSVGKNPKQEGQITEGLSSPQRLFVDTSRNLYVTNNGYGQSPYGDITIYARGATSPKLTITDGVDNPTGLTVDAAGTVYCANVTFPATITEYPAGESSPSLTIPLGSDNLPEYLATDASDNLYVSMLGGNVWKFAPGSTNGTNLNLQIGQAGALEVDRAGNIVVVDESASTLDFFAAGQTAPKKTLTVSGAPFALSLSRDEKALYVSVDATSEFIIQKLRYPGGKTLTTKIGGGVGDWPTALSPDNALGS
jgi:hypothetical protein